MSLAEYLRWWQQHKAGLDDRLLYLKDWHFVNEFPGYQVCTTAQIPSTWPECSVPHLLVRPTQSKGQSARFVAQAYTTPPYFQDDWLNQYYDMLSSGNLLAGTTCHSAVDPHCACCSLHIFLPSIKECSSLVLKAHSFRIEWARVRKRAAVCRHPKGV